MLVGLVLLVFTSYGQEDLVDDFLDESVPLLEEPPLMSECFTPSIKQQFVLHFESESGLIIDFEGPINQPIELYDENNILISVISSQHATIPLPRYKSYTLKTLNSCGDLTTLAEVSTTPQQIGAAFSLPQKLYDELAINSTDGLNRTILDFLSSNDRLNNVEKLYILQNYYFDGDLSIANIDLDNNLEDTPTEYGDGPFGFLGDSILLDVLDGYTRLGELIDVIVWTEPSRNCLCKATFPDVQGRHSIVKQTHPRNPNDPSTFNWFEHKYTPGRKSWSSAQIDQKVWRMEDYNKGAIRRHNADMFMRRSSSNQVWPWKAPDATNAASPYTTYMSYNLNCEDNNLQRDDCMCDNQILYVGASHHSDLTASGSKVRCVGCGNGFAYNAKVEEWAFLTKSSQKTGINILDGGRIYAQNWVSVTPNKDWQYAWFDLAANLLVTAGKLTLGDSTAWADSGSIVRAVNSIKTLATESPKIVEGGTDGASVSADLFSGGASTNGYSIRLRPNDPTYITIHSFAAHFMNGHTKYKTDVSINSYNWLAGFLQYQKRDECCAEEYFNWVIGVNDIAENEHVLRQVNSFIKVNNPRSLPLFPNRFDLEYTGNNEFSILNRYSNIGPGYQTSLCPPNYFSSYNRIANKPLTDSDLLPIGSSYIVTEILGINSVLSGSTSQQITLLTLKNQIINNSIINSGYYSLKLTVNGIEQNLKIFKP